MKSVSVSEDTLFPNVRTVSVSEDTEKKYIRGHGKMSVSVPTIPCKYTDFDSTLTIYRTVRVLQQGATLNPIGGSRVPQVPIVPKEPPIGDTVATTFA